MRGSVKPPDSFLLNPVERRIITALIAGQKLSEIAATLDCDENALTTRLWRCRYRNGMRTNYQVVARLAADLARKARGPDCL